VAAVRLLDRYIGRQLFVTSLFAIVVLSTVLVLGTIFKQLLDQVVNKNVPVALIFSFIQYVIPFSLTFTLPWGFLTAVLLVFGRLSAENELTAMRTSGVSIPRICLPVAVLALFFTGLCLWINLYVAPRAQDARNSAIFNIVTSNPLSFFGSDRVINELPKQKIYVERVEESPKGNILHNLQIYRLDDQGGLMSVMFVREGRLMLVQDEVKLPDGKTEPQYKIVLKYNEGRYEERSEEHPDDIDYWRPGVVVGAGSVEMPLKELYEKKKKVGGVSTLGLDELLKSEKPERYVEVSKRVSNALATLAFALLAVPLAVVAQRKETSVGFAISLAIGLVYYALFFMADMVRGRPKYHPELLVWAPNVLFFFFGALRFWRLAQR
jgi:lipopolysaccharide export LptBFGC system permease protein LptF